MSTTTLSAISNSSILTTITGPHESKDSSFSQSSIVILCVLFTIGFLIVSLSICLPWSIYAILKNSSKCKCFRVCFRIRSLNQNSNGADLANVNSTSVNFDSNQSDLPKYEDLVTITNGANVVNGVIGQQEIELNVLHASSNANSNNNDTQRNNNTLESDLNLPKYTELTLK